MDREIRPNGPSLIPIVILAWRLVADRRSGDGPSRSRVAASALRARVDVDRAQPISSVGTAVSRALRGGEPR
jgi:hypothetical protein